ncbi:MAG TPA: GNAT family N-acetyltransferase [Ferruginibacter sp.]|nr:GNAT family N-acetyltransferase [Ferruginibacter sp.]
MLELDFTPFPEISTQRLLLRKIEMTDAAAIMAMRSDEIVMQYIDRELITSIEAAEAWIQKVVDSLNNNSGINWAITLKEDPTKQIGTIGFWRLIKEHFRAEIGYMLNRNYWRMGIMKEAIPAVNEFGFKKMGLHSIEAHINPANKASAAILEATGFKREAYFKEDYYFHGKFLDTAIYSLLDK